MRDVAVVGGGPAGAAAAIALAREGFDVVLHDRARFPRPKPCGEFVNPGAVELLLSLGADLSGAAAVGRVRLGDAVVDLPRPGVTLARETLDARLIARTRACGVEVREGSPVRSRGSLDARLVIAADGARSALAREAGLVRPVARLQRIGWRARLPGDAFAPGEVLMRPAESERPDVFGVTRQADGSAVASGVLPTARSGEIAGGRLPAFVAERLGVEPFAADATACFGHSARPWADGLLLAGDAARFVDPFTGEGIHHALEGGLLAAEVGAAHLRRGRPLSDLSAARRGLEARYRLCDLVQTAVHTPWLAGIVAPLLAARPRGARRLFAAIADVEAPSPRLFLEAAFG